MHDIVRDFAISRCGDLQALHTRILDAVIAATPDGDWPIQEGLHGATVTRGTAGWYVAVYSPWHIQGAIGSGTDALTGDAKALALRLLAARAVGDENEMASKRQQPREIETIL